MVDGNFYNKSRDFTLKEIAEKLGCRLEAHNENELITDLAPLHQAQQREISFVLNDKYITSAIKAGACFIEEKYSNLLPDSCARLITKTPYVAFARLSELFYPLRQNCPYLQDKIDSSAIIGKNTVIGTNCSIGKNAKIGDNCIIGSGSHIGAGVQIGDNNIIGYNVTIIYSLIGNNNIIHSGVRIGQDSFSFATDEYGRHYKINQFGRVIMGNNIEVGANSCIDRGTLEDTIIEDMVQIGNLVEISHNVQIGLGSVLVSQTGIAGSSKIGKHVVMGGQVGVAGHLTIGDKVKISAKSGLMRDVVEGEIVGGIPAVPIKQWHRQTVSLAKLAKGEKK